MKCKTKPHNPINAIYETIIHTCLNETSSIKGVTDRPKCIGIFGKFICINPVRYCYENQSHGRSALRSNAKMLSAKADTHESCE